MPSHSDRVRRNYIDGDADKVEKEIKRVNETWLKNPPITACKRYGTHFINPNGVCVSCGKTEFELNLKG